MPAALDAGRGKIVRSRKAFAFEEILVVSERANHARSELWIQDSGMGGEIPPTLPSNKFMCTKGRPLHTKPPHGYARTSQETRAVEGSIRPPTLSQLIHRHAHAIRKT